MSKGVSIKGYRATWNKQRKTWGKYYVSKDVRGMPENCHDDWKTKDTDPDPEVWRMSLLSAIRKHPLLCWQSVVVLSITQSPDFSGRVEALTRSYRRSGQVRLTSQLQSVGFHVTRQRKAGILGGGQEECWNSWSLGQTSPTHPLNGLSLWLLTLCVISNHSHVRQCRYIWSLG